MCSLYFVILLLDFNKPQQKLMELIDSQELRRIEMEGRLQRLQEETEEMNSRLEDLDLQWDSQEERRKDLLPEANARRMKLVSAGPFSMGGRDEDVPAAERPVHTVYLSAYNIDPFPVTNADYREFVNCTGYKAPINWQRGTFPTGMGRHPVTNVSWQDAKAYCDWTGVRLSSEAEWEKAARGDDERPYPWGGRFVEGERCNSTNFYGTTTPVDEFPDGRSPFGLWDMAGNVYEWINDHYDKEYYKTSPATNPKGPEGGQERVVRGGDYQETRAGVRCTHRTGQAETYNRDNIGFRVGMDAE
jgi:formylglycine-generating enzyme required for sulfatase activity